MDRSNKPVSIYTIAEEAGVSASTVSRVLTGKGQVKKEKRERIEKLITEYNFRPNAAARTLKTEKSHLIGIIVPDIRNPFFSTLSVYCDRFAREQGYLIILDSMYGHEESESSNLLKLRDQQVEAIIQMSGNSDRMMNDPEYIGVFNEVTSTIPLITTGYSRGHNCYRVFIDEKESMRILVDYLISLGHRKIGIIGGNSRVHSYIDKKEVFRTELEKAGIPFEEQYLIEGKYSAEEGFASMRQALHDWKELPTAVIAINDLTAIGVYKAIIEEGLTIPGDISVVSFDNTYLAPMETPSLTSVDYHYETYARKIVDTTIRAIEGEKNIPLEQPNKPELVIRNSAARINSMP